MEEKTVNEVFITIQNFWIDYVLPRMEEIEVSLTTSEKLKLLNEMYQCAKDINPDTGEECPWRSWKIIGREVNCVKGTIMGVNARVDANSMMMPTYKRFTTAVRCWKALLEDSNAYAYKQQCSDFCNSCVVTTEESCCAVIKDLINTTFYENGIFEQINAKLASGEWELL